MLYTKRKKLRFHLQADLLINEQFQPVDYCIKCKKVKKNFVVSMLIQFKTLSLLIIALFIMKTSQAQLLNAHEWKHRVILLFAQDPDQPTLVKELELLTSSSAEVTERDLVVYQIFPDSGLKPNAGELGKAAADRFADVYKVSSDQPFTFILIGKDGTEKLRRHSLVSMEKLFGLIDQMPMRRAEMRKDDVKSRSDSQH